MSDAPTQSDSHEQRLDELIAEYLQARDAGAAIDEQAFLSQHPEFAGRLKAFFDDRRRLDRLAARVNPIHSAPTIGAESAPAGPRPGTRLRYFGDYELLEEIARGGMGIVFKARQVSLNRVVALKMILSGNFASDADVRRFHAEAESAANLDHPNIVPIYEVGEHENLHYFSMKLIEGGSLARNIARFTADPKAGAKLLSTIARAIHHAHLRGILHRDIKPGNILLDKDGEPRVTDFGLARQVDGNSSLTLSGAIVGTPSYMPPEQAAGDKSLTTAVDVYSLGAILYEVTTGRPPFAAATPVETLRKVLVEAPPRPAGPRGRLDRDLETIILKCLEKDPQRRYPSALALAEELDRWVEGKPIEARPVGAVERGWRWCRRNPLVATLLLVISLSLLAGAGISSWFAVKASAHAREAENSAVLARQQQQRANSNAEEAARNEKLALAAKEDAAQKAVQEEKARRDAEISLYFSRIAQAQNELAAQNISRAEEVLDECPEKFRGWEWNYLKRMRFGAQMKLLGHKNSIWGVSFSHDNKRLVTASWDATARVWDVATGKQIHELKHTNYVWAARFSPDGKFIATAGNSGVKIWNAESGVELQTLGHDYPSAVMNLNYSSDGKRLASCGYDGTVRLWDFAANKELPIFRGHQGGVRGITFSPDDRRLVSAGDDATVRVWDIESGKLVFPPLPTRGPSWGVAISPDGQMIAAPSPEGTVQLWDANTGRERSRILTDTNFDVSFSADGRRLLTCSWNKTVKLWDVATSREILTLRGHEDSVHRVAFSPDGTHIAAVGFDHQAIVWDGTPPRDDDQRDSLTFGTQDSAIMCVAWSPDGKHIGSSHGNEIRIWDAASLKTNSLRTSDKIQGSDTGVRNFAFSPDGRRIASTGWREKSIRIRDVESGSLLKTLDGHTDNVTCVAFSQGGDQLVSGGDGGESAVRLWDLATGGQRELGRHGNSVGGVAFDPSDPSRIASVGGDSQLRMWGKVDTDAHVAPAAHTKWISTVVFDPKGERLVTASHDGAAIIWNATSLTKKFTLTGHTDRVMCAAFSPDGTRVATGSGDGMVRLWDASNGKPLYVLRGHSGYVWSLAFSPDGQQLVSAGGNRTRGEIKLWFLDKLKPATNDAQ